MSEINIEKKGELVTLSVDIPYILKDQLKFHSYKEKKAIKDIVREALEEYFHSTENK
jgi:hypothetical protein